MAVKFKVSAQGEEYTDANGQTKRRSIDMGIVVQTKNGYMLKLNAIPIGWDGWAYLNEPEQRPQKGQPRAHAQQRQQPRPPGGGYERNPPQSAGFDDMDDDIPF